MYAESESIAAPSLRDVQRPAPTRMRAEPLRPDKRSLAGANFADEIIACMREGRGPVRIEIQKVAAGIWDEVQTGAFKIAWRDLVPGCRPYDRMIAAARAALGDLSEAGRQKAPP